MFFVLLINREMNDILINIKKLNLKLLLTITLQSLISYQLNYLACEYYNVIMSCLN